MTSRRNNLGYNKRSPRIWRRSALSISDRECLSIACSSRASASAASADPRRQRCLGDRFERRPWSPVRKTLAPSFAKARAIAPPILELLSTVDWLLDKGGYEADLRSIREGIAKWPSGKGAAQRKQKLFDDRLLELALNRLKMAPAIRESAPLTA